VQGTFDITCVRRPDGGTAVGHQAISAPWHLSKPYWDGQVLLVQAVNATAGIFAGDHLEFRVQVDPGASVLLTSPSASRIHTMPHGEATLSQKIEVASGGWLEWMPELFIPHKDCRYRQRTEVRADRGARMYMVETLAPGRVAHGEAFAFDRMEWTTHLRYAGKLVLAERYPMSPADHSLADVKAAGGPRYFASAVLVNDGPLPWRDWQYEIHAWNDGTTGMGGTQLAEDVYLFRLLAGSSERMKDALGKLRGLLAQEIAPLRQSARKL